VNKNLNEIWLGPLLGNNRSRLIERCVQLVANDQSDKFLYLAASHPLLEVVTQGILDGDRNRGVWGELPVYLFRGFVRRILSTSLDSAGSGVPPRVPIDREELPLQRSLVSQILTKLVSANKIKALAPMATREGCVNTISTLLGEIQRAGKTPAEVDEIVAARMQDLMPQSTSGKSQVDFDNEIALIYSTYLELLNGNKLTEDDTDQLRALAALRDLELPWLNNVELLVLDGFFDFTPVQGEILRQLIPRIPETLVNLNHDERNPEIFVPFQETIGQLSSIASFDTKQTTEAKQTSGALATLRENLFNPAFTPTEASDESDSTQTNIRYFECGDRDSEIHTIAREIKRLVLQQNFKLSDIALVVRQRAAYAPTISRVMQEERIPCNLELRIEAGDVPANRAALKLFALFEQLRDESGAYRITEVADLVKSEYFRLGNDDLQELSTRFDELYLNLLCEEEAPDAETISRFKSRYRIGFWDADAFENAVAYVGSDLPISSWLRRADTLIKELPGAQATKELLSIDQGAQDRDQDIADQVENAETAKLEDKSVEKKPRPSRDIHPATLAWTALITRRLSELIHAVPHEGRPTELRFELMKLLDRLQFRDQVARPTRKTTDERELPQVTLNFNALESLRRALVAAIKSIELARTVDSNSSESTQLSMFVSEVRRSLASQSQVMGAADRGGLRILEATDVRGLQFRAIFIAGLIEGGFPLRASRDWIYPHEERDRLKQYGLTLEDISPATLLKEEHYFYQSACRASERLYLSRPLLLEDDSETVASYYIDELRRAVAPLKIEAETVRRDYDGKNIDLVSGPAELAVALIRQDERERNSGDKQRLLAEPKIKRLITLARNDGFISSTALRRIEIERQRAGLFFGPYDGQIVDPELLRLLQQRFGREYVYSASGLSVFGNCPYRFFAQRVLKLEPRGEAALDLQAIDAGKLLHDILRRFFEHHRRQSLTDLNLDQLRLELAKIADQVFDEHERVVPPLNRQIWKIDREIRKILLDQVLLYELGIQNKAADKRVLPAYFEIAFGNPRSEAKDPASQPAPLELTRKTFVGEETTLISGQIDRVDIAADDTFIAYDYKLSVGSSKDDIRSGRNLQIPIYLEALERLILPGRVMAGGGYYIIRGSSDRRNKGLYRKSKNEYLKISTQAHALMSEEEWVEIRQEAIERIWFFLDQIKEGKFYVDPSEREKTCRFCDFTAVCRYKRDRIDSKKKS